MSDSPAEYIQKLEAQVRTLRASAVRLSHEKQILEVTLAKCSADALMSQPARPGIEEVD